MHPSGAWQTCTVRPVEALLASQRRQLHFQAWADSDDMIVADLALVAQAEDPVQIQPPVELAIGRAGLPGTFANCRL